MLNDLLFYLIRLNCVFAVYCKGGSSRPSYAAPSLARLSSISLNAWNREAVVSSLS